MNLLEWINDKMYEWRLRRIKRDVVEAWIERDGSNRLTPLAEKDKEIWQSTELHDFPERSEK